MWSKDRFSISTTTMWSIPHDFGDGRVSPNALKMLNTRSWPGIERSDISPTARSAAEIAGPLAPDSSVRSRSKKAAPAWVCSVLSAMAAP